VIFTHIRKGLETNRVVFALKADFLLYLLLDAVMEISYVTIENEEDKVEELITLSRVNSRYELKSTVIISIFFENDYSA
jgi:magnesium transporter